MSSVFPHGPFCSRDIKLDAPIYRIHPHKYLEQLLSGRLVLRATTCWTDPYENLVSRCAYSFIGEGGRIQQKFIGGNRYPTFGQCWTTIPESDAMWRIYSHVKQERSWNSFFSVGEGVRLRSTARKLINYLAEGMGKRNEDNCYIARVTYLQESQLGQYVANAVGTYRDTAFSSASGHADALLIKRAPFSYEAEVRLLYIDTERRFEGKSQIEVPINVNDLIEDITLDPRLMQGGGEQRRKAWLERNGFKNTISTSLLYLGVLMDIPLFKPEDLNPELKRNSDSSQKERRRESGENLAVPGPTARLALRKAQVTNSIDHDRLLTVAEDIEHFQNWWKYTEAIDNIAIRHGSTTLKRLLVENAVGRAWRQMGFAKAPTLQGPDLLTFYKDKGIDISLVLNAASAGVRLGGLDTAIIGSHRSDNPQTGVPATAEEGFAVVVSSVMRKVEEEDVQPPSELERYINRDWFLDEYLAAPGMIRRGQVLSRSDVIEHMAQEMGSVRHRGRSSQMRDLQVEAERKLFLETKTRTIRGHYIEVLAIGQAVGRSDDLQQLVNKIRSC